MENVQLCPDFVGYDRLAARHLFSQLSYLERIAVTASLRGDAVAGQLDDERVHRDTFAILAARLGGMAPMAPEVKRLIEYLQAQQGEMSLAMLNVVAESWLDTVFKHVGSWGMADELFASIEADEARHVYDALQSAVPAPAQSAPVLGALERMLWEISLSPAFMLPLIHLGGPKRTAEMGLAIARAHACACDHLGVEPDTYRLRLLCRGQRMLPECRPVSMTSWQRSKMVLAEGRPMQQLLHRNLPIGDCRSPAKLQARLIRAMARVLARHPEMRLVTRRGQLFETPEPVIGLRALYDESQVVTVYVRGAHRRSTRQVIAGINRRLKRIRGKPYQPIPYLAGLEDLLPPSLCNVALSYNGHWGGESGTGPLIDIEGVPIVVTVGEPHDRPRWDGECWQAERVVTLTVAMDHRVGDGREIGHFATETIEEMERLQ